jgi:DNA repair exonuclease SbcCD ATPase subunit
MKSHKMCRLATIICGVCLTVAAITDAHAQAKDSPEIAARRALAKADFMLRQTTAEKSALEQQVTELQAQLKSIQESQKKDTLHFAEREDKYQTVLGDIKEKYLALAEKLKQSLAVNRKQEAELAQFQQDVSYRVDQLKSCAELNAGLLALNNEFLAAYESKSAWESLFQEDGVTGLTQVDVENKVQDLRDRNEDLRLSLPANLNLGANQ